MRALFPRWADSLARSLLWSSVAALVLVPVILMAWVRTGYRTGVGVELEQPLAFDHRHHVRDDGIACGYCHAQAERAATAGMPTTGTCLNCHSQIWNDSPLLAAVWSSRERARPIAWRRVNRVPDFVFFNHAVHTTAGVACDTCHGRVDQMARVYQAQPLTMGWCLDCHRHPRPRADGVAIAGPTYCSACHR